MIFQETAQFSKLALPTKQDIGISCGTDLLPGRINTESVELVVEHVLT
jgi:hypothetical protein